MSIVRRPSPFGELVSLRQAMDRLFEDSYVRPGNWGREAEGSLLPLDIYRTDDALVVRAALPGIKPDDVQVTVEGDTLTVSGEFKDERESNERGYLFRELQRGHFSRTVQLPGDVAADRAEAHYDNGVLTLTLPKREEAKPRQIRISASGNVENTSANGSGSAGPSGAH